MQPKEQLILNIIKDYEGGLISHPNTAINKIKDIVAEDKTKDIDIDLDIVITKAAELFNISIKEMKTRNRSFSVVNARRVFYLLCKDIGIKKSTSEVARYFSQDHASYIYQVKTGKLMLEQNKYFKEKYLTLKALFVRD